MDEMVNIYADVMCRRFITSKLVLIGWSFGGLLAYEVARILTLFGIDIAYLFMLDACFLFPQYSSKEHLLQRFSYDLLQSSGLISSVTPSIPEVNSIEELLEWLTAAKIYHVKKSQYHYFEAVFHAFTCNTIA